MKKSNFGFAIKELLLVKVLFLSTPIWAGVPSKSVPVFLLEARPVAGQVEFNAVGKPSLLKIKGKGQGPSGSIRIVENKASGKFSFDLATLDTGIELRNRHMKEKYLKVGQHSLAKLELDPIVLPKDWAPEKVVTLDLPFKGRLELAGVSKPVSGKVITKSAEKQMQVVANFDIKISDFGIDIPSFAGITVADSVQVQVTLDRSQVTQGAAP